ncbi:MAG: ATP-binding protein [Candidatus Nanopelagicales bacterium]|nr:ATP-binding protein [Candidatus Nanopelagicales bacterium]
MRIRIRLSADADQLAIARAALEEWAWPQLAGRPALVDDLVIVANELCSNAIRHGDAPITVTAALHGARVRISVSNRTESPALIRPSGTTGRLDPGGRGLLVVAQLAQAWGWSSGRGTTLVWAELGAGSGGTRG